MHGSWKMSSSILSKIIGTPLVIQISLSMLEINGCLRKKFCQKISQIDACKMKLQQTRAYPSGETVHEIQRIRGRLTELLIQEEQYWKQRAKTFWLAEGDSNTRFFHSMATSRNHNNKIHGLWDEEDRWVDTPEGLCKVVKDYFIQLFIATPIRRSSTNMLFWRHVTRLDNEGLIRPFTFDEFELAVKQMHPDKAPRPDGLNPAFYQFYWPVMGKEIFNVCSSWPDKKELPANLNGTLLTLIPKCESPTTMRELRPIALCNVLYKIIAKVLANRLKTILPHIISDTQSAFVPGRSILDNVIVAFEMLHSIKKGERKGRGSGFKA